MAELVYVLCALTCLVCMLLLAQGYRRSRMRLLAWSTACFAGLFLNNVLVVIDLVLVPEADLEWIRGAVAYVAVAVMAAGLIWESS